MAENKKGLVIGGSILGVVIIGLAIGLGVGLSAPWLKKDDTNAMGIGAFSNLESFDNDGFNNGVKVSAQEYLEGQSKEYAKPYHWRKKLDLQTSQYSDDGHEYVDMMNDYYGSNDIIISAGFQVAGAITGAAPAEDGSTSGFDGVFTTKDGKNTEYANSKKKSVVMMDDAYLSTLYTNAASVSFAAEGAGYLSAMAAGIYTTWDSEVNDGSNKIVMWGGLPFPTVYDYMSGFAQGITDFNENFGTTIELYNGVSKDEYNTIGTDNDSKWTWFSGGFDATTGTPSGDSAKARTDWAMENNASIVFPIAGGNTTVAENELVAAGDITTKLIGVDSDYTMSSSNDDLYIGSAQKNLVEGGQLALWGIDDFDGDGERNYEETEIDANDEYGLEHEAEYKDWIALGEESVGAENIQGIQLRGDLGNGGAGYIYGDAASAGMNADFAKAEEYFYGVGTYTDTKYGSTNLSELIKAIQEDESLVVNAEDEHFTAS